MTQIKYDTYPMSPEGGRFCYYYTHYLIIKQYLLSIPGWSLGKGITIGQQKAHATKWFFAHDESVFIEKARAYIDQPSRIKEVEKYTTDVREKSIAYVEGVNPESLSNEELAHELQTYDTFFIEHLRAASILRHIDRGVVSIVRTQAADASSADRMLEQMAIPTRQSFALREELAIIEAAAAVSQGAKREERAEGLTRSFAWASLGYYNELARDVHYYMQTIQEHEKASLPPSEKLNELRQNFDHNIEQRARFVATLDTEMQTIAHLASESAFLKDSFKFSINEFQYHGEKLFVEAEKRISLPFPRIKDLAPEELRTLLRESTLDTSHIAERMRHNIIACDTENAFETFDGAEADAFEQTFLHFEHASHEFKGRIACRGFVRGSAVVITSSNDFAKMEKGRVLIAINTTPDYVPIMRQATAIVAEEGGITAHVSVVSREMGIPCVVGIRNITHILKDGDEVEVDAEKGIVRKL